MKRALIIVLSFISLNVFAQKSDTLITYSFGDYTKAIAKTGETYKVYRKDSVWIKTTFNAKHAIVKTETFADKKLKTLNGEYQEYNNEKVSLKGFYSTIKKQVYGRALTLMVSQRNRKYTRRIGLTERTRPIGKMAQQK